MEDEHEIIRKSLPGILGELARGGFLRAALILGKEWCGTQRYIPKKADGSRLADLIGLEAARFASKEYGGVPVDIPSLKASTHIKLKIALHEGDTREVAQELGCSERWVRIVRKDLGITPSFRRTNLNSQKSNAPISGPQGAENPAAAPTPAENLLNADLNARRRNDAHAKCPATTKS